MKGRGIGANSLRLLTMRFIDTHAHLNDPKFETDVDAVIARAREAGVERIINCGYDLASSRSAIDLADRYTCLYATVGVHPHDAKHYDESAERALTELAQHPKVLAIGETGVDFHYGFSPRSDQHRRSGRKSCSRGA